MRVGLVLGLNDYELSGRPVASLEFINIGISYISSTLKSIGCETDLLVIPADDIKKADEFVRETNPDVLCFTAVATQYESIKSIAARIKKTRPDIYLVIGGPHATLNPETVIDGPFDALCIGEGEKPLAELAAQLMSGKKPSHIRNMWFKQEDGVERNPTRPFLNDLDSLPFPDRLMWRKYVLDFGKRQVILLGRGCPFNCSYCCNHRLRSVAAGEYARLRSGRNVLAEIKHLEKQFPEMERIYLEIETFGANIPWAVQLCAMLAEHNSQREKPLVFGVNLRVVPGIDYKPLFLQMHAAGFRWINIGLESGSERIRKLMRRHYSNQDVIRTAEDARKCGLQVRLFVMVGLPGETKEDFKATVEAGRRCRPSHLYNSVFFPYSGTDLHDFCEKEGLLKSTRHAGLERTNPVFGNPGFSKNQIKAANIMLPYLILKGNVPLPLVLFRVVEAWAATNKTTNRAFKMARNYLRLVLRPDYSIWSFR